MLGSTYHVSFHISRAEKKYYTRDISVHLWWSHIFKIKKTLNILSSIINVSGIHHTYLIVKKQNVEEKSKTQYEYLELSLSKSNSD